MKDHALWLNGRLVSPGSAGISPFDRGFTLGDGVFETMLALNGKVVGLTRHLGRLRYSAGVIGLDVPFDDPELVHGIKEAVTACGLSEATVRLTTSRGPGPGLEPPQTTSPTTVASVVPHTGMLHGAESAGIRMVTSSIRRNDTSPLSRIKSLNYLDNVLARAEARRHGVEDALLLNTKGLVACGTASNIFVVVKGAIMTPPMRAGVLPGITRSYILELASRLGIACEEAEICPEVFRDATEVFLTNSLTGVLPVIEIDNMAVGRGRPGEITHLLAKSYSDAMLAGAYYG
ncbi:MAG: aminotransferase class IV [Chloroflexi bacterium]|nr:aminotransferase class IV [Chloroflexota bacterium]